MKKSESVLNGYLGCGKPRYVVAFPQILFDLRSLIPPKKFTMKGGERTITALKNPLELAFSRRNSTKFDITKKNKRRTL